MQAVVVCVVKDGCESCKIYKDHQQKKLVDLIRSDLRLGMLTYKVMSGVNDPDLTLESVNVKIPRLTTEYHPDILTTYWKWWPSWMVFPIAAWNNHEVPLEGLVFCADIETNTNGEKEMIANPKSSYSVAAESIYPWILDALDTLTRESSPVIMNYSDYKNANRTFYVNR